MAESIANKVWDIVIKWDYFAKETVGKQLVKAADSISANIAESHGRYHYQDKKNFGYYSRGSLEESKVGFENLLKENYLHKNKPILW